MTDTGSYEPLRDVAATPAQAVLDGAEPAPTTPTPSAGPAPADVPQLPRIAPSLVDRVVRRLAPAGPADRYERRRFARTLPPGLARSGTHSIERRQGRLRLVEPHPGLIARDARRLNRQLVTDACAAIGADYFAVPDPGAASVRIGVPAEQWTDVVDELARRGATVPIYLGVNVLSAPGTPHRSPGLAADPLIAGTARDQANVEVFRFMSPRANTRVFAATSACVVERWDREPDGTLLAPAPNARTTRIGPSFQTAATMTAEDGATLPTFACLTDHTVFEIDFPVDVVYLWVDGSDPRWLERRAAAMAEYHGDVGRTAVAQDRFRDNGELRYSLRSLERFAPWVRRVFLVTDQQVPDWLETAHPRLTVVDHRELFADAGRLPTYNSHAIGARLHHIDGLAEHYLCVNDDVLLGREVGPELFFQSNGVSKFFLSRTTLDMTHPRDAPEHENARRNVVRLLARDFGRSPTRAFFHTPIPQRRSVMAELEQRYPEEFARTWSSQFRSDDDYETNSWLHHYYGYLTGRATPASIRYIYCGMADETAWRRIRRLGRRRDIDVFCVNDDAAASQEQYDRVMEWLAQYFAGPSSFER